MGPVNGRGFGGSVKFADGKTSSANVPHLNVWDFDIFAAEFPHQKTQKPLRAYSHQRRAFFLLRKFCYGYIKTPYI